MPTRCSNTHPLKFFTMSPSIESQWKLMFSIVWCFNTTVVNLIVKILHLFTKQYIKITKIKVYFPFLLCFKLKTSFLPSIIILSFVVVYSWFIVLLLLDILVIKINTNKYTSPARFLFNRKWNTSKTTHWKWKEKYSNLEIYAPLAIIA